MKRWRLKILAVALAAVFLFAIKVTDAQFAWKGESGTIEMLSLSCEQITKQIQETVDLKTTLIMKNQECFPLNSDRVALCLTTWSVYGHLERHHCDLKEEKRRIKCRDV